MNVRVLLADDSSPFLGAVTEALEMSHDLEVVGAAPDGEQALVLAAQHVPDVAVIDIEMPDGGAGLAARLVAQQPGLRVMALTARDDERTVIDMLAAGCIGYVVKGSLDEDLATCVRRAAAGVLFVVASCADGVRQRIADLDADS